MALSTIHAFQFECGNPTFSRSRPTLLSGIYKVNKQSSKGYNIQCPGMKLLAVRRWKKRQTNRSKNRLI